MVDGGCIDANSMLGSVNFADKVGTAQDCLRLPPININNLHHIILTCHSVSRARWKHDALA